MNNIIRVGLLVCSALPLLSCFMELFVAATASQPHFNTVSEETEFNKKKDDDASVTANVAAQKHFRQIQHIC
ncbi:hypothetical protein LR48_Vigan07g077400 [Vigna angularis]|uniref:Uncharacterized protein n=2 Tax=Phaseolus angularis TaxID=3914 RepID=A0A0L9UW39_PHAAN|nr:hypothetical protein LR48_Vigan07g077400 [Vigna angularis]BAT81281.1 hypothetical protein VIGAN_03096800 [Vigna angularis var. angularis]